MLYLKVLRLLWTELTILSASPGHLRLLFIQFFCVWGDTASLSFCQHWWGGSCLIWICFIGNVNEQTQWTKPEVWVNTKINKTSTVCPVWTQFNTVWGVSVGTQYQLVWGFVSFKKWFGRYFLWSIWTENAAVERKTLRSVSLTMSCRGDCIQTTVRS